jgi:hypothetical protein
MLLFLEISILLPVDEDVSLASLNVSFCPCESSSAIVVVSSTPAGLVPTPPSAVPELKISCAEGATPNRTIFRALSSVDGDVDEDRALGEADFPAPVVALAVFLSLLLLLSTPEFASASSSEPSPFAQSFILRTLNRHGRGIGALISFCLLTVSFIYPPSHAPHLYAVQEAPGEIVELTHKDVGHNGEPVCVLHLPCVGDEGLNVTGKGQRYRQENGPPSLNVVRELDLVQVQQSIFRLHPLEA